MMFKRALPLLLVLCSFSLSALEISIEVSSFKNKDASYLEAYVRVLGETVLFKELEHQPGFLQGGVELTLLVMKGESIVNFERYNLTSPITEVPKDFLDVKRFALNPGVYVLKVEAVDSNNPDNALTLEKRVEVHAFEKKVNLSDVQLFGSVVKTNPSNPLSKNGFLMEPLTYGFLSPDISVLNIYSEVYRTKTAADSSCFVRYAIVEGHSNQSGEVMMQKYKKLSNKQREPLLLKLPVDKLPSGKYHVLVELFDKTKKVLSSRVVDFLRSNPDYDIEYWMNYNKEEDYDFITQLSIEELEYALRAISAIVYEPKKSIMNFMIKKAPIRAKRKFLFDFWKEQAPSSPEFSYQRYMEIVKAVDIEYNNNVGYGFETDRGYIFLRYGKPNNVLSIDTEPDSYPYEIWYYNYLKETNQTNVRFIFYNKSLVHNDYALLHSTCLGERQYPQWEIELYRKGLEVPNSNPIDATTVQDSWQRNARRFFNDF